MLRLLEEFFGEGHVEFELSVRVGNDVLIPDLVVLRSNHPSMYRDILDESPLLCVEVVSPSQRPAELLAKCERYRAFGVDYCWVVDPITLQAWEYHRHQTEPRLVTEAFSGPCQLRVAHLAI